MWWCRFLLLHNIILCTLICGDVGFFCCITSYSVLWRVLSTFSLMFGNWKCRVLLPLLYAESISAWSNQGSVMCLLSILNQFKKYGGNIYLSIYLIIQLEIWILQSVLSVNGNMYMLLDFIIHTYKDLRTGLLMDLQLEHLNQRMDLDLEVLLPLLSQSRSKLWLVVIYLSLVV